MENKKQNLAYPSEEKTRLNSVKNSFKYNYYNAKRIKKNQKYLFRLINELSIDFLIEKKNICTKIEHYKQFNSISFSIENLKKQIEKPIRPLFFALDDSINLHQNISTNSCGIRFMIEFRPKIFRKNGKPEPETIKKYKDKYFRDNIFRKIISITNDLIKFKQNVFDKNSKKIINVLINNLIEIKEFTKNANILHLLFFQSEFTKSIQKNDYLDSVMIYYYWSENNGNINEIPPIKL